MASLPGHPTPGGTGLTPHKLVAYLLTLRESGDRVALGFECPAWIPVPQNAIDLGAKRNGEGRYPWSAGAGAGALATGLAQIAWILRNLNQSEQSKVSQEGRWAQGDDVTRALECRQDWRVAALGGLRAW